MSLWRERNTLFGAALLTAFSLGFAGYAESTAARIQKGLSQHGFDRSLVIYSDGPAEMHGDEATRFIADAPTNSHGASALFARESALELLRMPEIDAVMAVTHSPGQLSLSSGPTTRVSVFNVPPEFIRLYKIGDESLLRRGVYVPSAELLKLLKLTASASSGTIGPPQELINALPLDMRENVDWSAARRPVQVSSVSFDLPAGNGVFDNALFTTGKEEPINVPGLFLIPSVRLFVKLRDDVDLVVAADKLRRFVSAATPAQGRSLAIMPMTEFFADQLRSDRLAGWNTGINNGIVAVALLLLIALATIKNLSLRREVALRKAFGVTHVRAILLSVRPVVVALIAGCVIGGATLSTSLMVLMDSAVTTFLPIWGKILMLALISVLLLVGITGFSSRSDLVFHLKND